MEIIDRTMPKVVFLENVENLVSHNKGETFRIILNTLENELNYHVIGVERDEKGELTFDEKVLHKKHEEFRASAESAESVHGGIQQGLFRKTSGCFAEGNSDRRTERNIPFGFGHSGYRGFGEIFLSSGLLETLEKHRARQKSNGNGFGYRVVNDTSITRPLAHTILATGGSGKERNLIYDPVNGRDIAGTDVKGKKETP